MHKSLFPTLAVAALILSGVPALAQSGGDGARGSGSGDSGGEQPYGGNTLRDEDLRRQQLLAPKAAAESEDQIALHLVEQHQYPDAIPHLEAALAKKPGDAQLLFYLGYAHHMIGQKETAPARDGEYKIALDDYTRSIAADASNRMAHQYMGTLHLQMHDQAGAADELKTLSDLCPSGCPERDSLTKALAAYQSALDAMTKKN